MHDVHWRVGMQALATYEEIFFFSFLGKGFWRMAVELREIKSFSVILKTKVYY